MRYLVVNHLLREKHEVHLSTAVALSQITEELFTKETQSQIGQSIYVTCDGKKVNKDDLACDGKVYHISPCLVGGKGGFGSMLRAIGAQIEKTTNHEACRDISGRRMRDVNNEKQLKEWISKKADKEKERERQRQERTARRRAMPNHKFDDPKYEKQKALVAENLEDALQKGLMKAKPGPSSTVTSATATSSGESRKRKTDTSTAGPSSKIKKETEWLGIDIENLSDMDSDDENGESSNDGKSPLSYDHTDNEDIEKSNEKLSATSSEQDSDSRNSFTAKENSKVHNEELESAKNNIEVHHKAEDSLSDDIKQNANVDLKQLADSSSDNTQQKVNDGISDPDDGKRVEENIPKHSLLIALDNISKKTEHTDTDMININSAKLATGPINLDEYTSALELEPLGLDKLKSELMDRGLKCGGSLKERTERLFSVKGLAKEQIDQALFAKSSNGKGVKNRSQKS